jgi:2-polyprenyl-6-methoxyphenol hydroxylase-like FAD-dependent oxidoreductase
MRLSREAAKSVQLPIIISGTGPSALLLAHALKRATPAVPFRLYERDLSMTHRSQGYRFRVTGRGVRSCRDVLDPDHFELLRATCGDNQTAGTKRIDALTGEPLPSPPFRHSQAVDDEPLTADRTLFRQVLFKRLEDDTTFGKEIVGYQDIAAADDDHDDTALASNESHRGGGRRGVLVRFADGSTERGALLVGADGAFSRVRAQLAPEVRLRDSEMRMIFGKTPLTPAFFAALGVSGDHDPHAAELLNGLTLPVDSTKAPMFFRFDTMRFGRRASAAAADPDLAAAIPRDYVYWALALRSDQSEAQGLDWRAMDASSAAGLAEDLTKAWLPWLHAVVTHQDRTQTMPLLSAVMPVPLLDWRALDPARGPMVTLIGDAAHAMPPTGGLGVTTALTDSAVLGAALSEHGVSRRALEVYESEMRAYAAQAIEQSVEGGKMVISMRELAEMKPMGH